MSRLNTIFSTQLIEIISIVVAHQWKLTALCITIYVSNDTNYIIQMKWYNMMNQTLQFHWIVVAFIDYKYLVQMNSFNSLSLLTFVSEHAISTSTFDMMLLKSAIFKLIIYVFVKLLEFRFVVHSLKSIFLFESQTYCKQNKSNGFVLEKVLSFKQLWNSHDSIPFFFFLNFQVRLLKQSRAIKNISIVQRINHSKEKRVPSTESCEWNHSS